MGATSTNPLVFAEAITRSWASLQMKPRASQLGQPALESFSFTFQYIRRGREECPRVPIFREMLQLPGHILTFKIFPGKVMRIWKQHVFLGELIWPIRQGVICLSKSVHESLFQIKRNDIFLGPSKSNTTFMFLFQVPSQTRGYLGHGMDNFKQPRKSVSIPWTMNVINPLASFPLILSVLEEEKEKSLPNRFSTISFCLKIHTNTQGWLLYIMRLKKIQLAGWKCRKSFHN